MTALYELTTQLHELHSLVLTGEATEDFLADTLEAIEGEFEEKALQVGRFVLSLKPSVEAIDTEIKRLQARKKAIQAQEDRVKSYLRDNMEAAEISKIECPLFTILCKKPQQRVVVDDESALPDDFVSVKTVVSPDKKALLKALKEGGEVKGAHLELSKAPIQIS